MYICTYIHTYIPLEILYNLKPITQLFQLFSQLLIKLVDILFWIQLPSFLQIFSVMLTVDSSFYNHLEQRTVAESERIHYQSLLKVPNILTVESSSC